MSYRPTPVEIRAFIKQKADEMGGFEISKENAINALIRQKSATVPLSSKPPHSLENVKGLINAGVSNSNLISSKIPRSLLLRAKNNIQLRNRTLKLKSPGNPFTPSAMKENQKPSIMKQVERPSISGNPFTPSSMKQIERPSISSRPVRSIPTFSGALDISTIDKLNTWIATRTAVNMTGPDIMTPRDSPGVPGGLEPLATRFLLEVPKLLRSRLISLNPGQTVEKFREDISFLNTDYHMIYNSGGGVNDCLIISFLMGVSPVYRKLSYAQKYEISSIFRRELLPQLIRSSEVVEVRDKLRTDAQLIPLLLSNQPLTDSHITCLVFLYKINIVSLETGKSSGRRGEPPTVTFIEPANPPSFTSGIIICNRGNGHYEIVVTKPNKYISTEPELRAFYNRIQDVNPFVDGKRTGDEMRGQLESAEISFRDGDYVMYRGQRYIVIERNLDTSSGNIVLVGAWITKDIPDVSLATKLNTAGSSKLKKSVNVEQKLGEKNVIYVLTKSLNKIAGGGSCQCNRCIRKTRKLLRNRR